MSVAFGHEGTLLRVSSSLSVVFGHAGTLLSAFFIFTSALLYTILIFLSIQNLYEKLSQSITVSQKADGREKKGAARSAEFLLPEYRKDTPVFQAGE